MSGYIVLKVCACCAAVMIGTLYHHNGMCNVETVAKSSAQEIEWNRARYIDAVVIGLLIYFFFR